VPIIEDLNSHYKEVCRRITFGRFLMWPWCCQQPKNLSVFALFPDFLFRPMGQSPPSSSRNPPTIVKLKAKRILLSSNNLPNSVPNFLQWSGLGCAHYFLITKNFVLILFDFISPICLYQQTSLRFLFFVNRV
jgi:hypothetical protein